MFGFWRWGINEELKLLVRRYKIINPSFTDPVVLIWQTWPKIEPLAMTDPNDHLHIIYQYNYALNQIIITKLLRRLRIPLLWTFCHLDFHITLSMHLDCICTCYCCCSKMENLRSSRLINCTRLLLPNLPHFRRLVHGLEYTELPFTVESGSSFHYESLTAESLYPTHLERIL